MKDNMKKYDYIKTFTFLLILLLVVFSSFSGSSIYASEQAISNEDEELYVNDDSLIITDDYSIRDYPDLINTRGGIYKNTSLYGGYEWKMYGVDDPIVEIIPKDLFYTEGSHVCIGDEYGFYIHTEKVKSNSYGPVENMHSSIALVFDITTNTNLVETTDRVIVSVEPIFQYKYVCLNGSGISGIQDYMLEYDLDEPWVIAYPTTMNDNLLKYDMCNEYYLKDVSFGATLFNEQALNKGDEGYDPYNDDGSYFTGFDYSFSGKAREYGKFSGGDLALNIVDSIMYGIGYLDAVPVVGTVTAVIGQVYDTVMLGNNWIGFANDTYSDINGTINQVDKTVTTTCYYQNRDDQLSHYKDENGNPFLTKTVALAINTTEEKSIWYGADDNITAYFNINHSALSGTAPEYTRFTNHLALKIVSSDSDETIAICDRIITDTFREQNVKELKLNAEDSVYFLPNGEDSFSFKPEYSGNYDINVSLSQSGSVIINDTVYTGNHINISRLINSEELVDLRITGNSLICGSIEVTVSNKLTNLSINSNCELIVGASELSGVKKIITNNSNIVVQKVLYYSGDEFKEYQSYGTLTSDSQLTLPFKSNNDYYLILKNQSTTNMDNVSIAVTEVESIDVGTIETVTLLKNLTYFELFSEIGSQYVMTVSNSSSNDFQYKILDEDLIVLTNGYSYSNGEYIISFDANKKYYIGITNFYKGTSKVSINLKEDAYQWEIDGGEYDCYRTFERQIYLKRGYTYYFSFVINDHLVITDLFSEDDPTNYYGGYNISITSSGKLAIPSSTPVRGSGITVKARYNDTDLSYNHTIKVIPEFNNSTVSMTTYNSSDLGFTLNLPNYVNSIEYSLSIGSIEKNYSLTNQNYSTSSSITKSILNDYNDLDYGQGVSNIIIKVYKLNIITANNGIYSYNCNISQSVNNLFFGGDGSSTNPYLIYTYRHLDNLRNVSSSNITGYFKLMSDIYCPQSNTGYYWDAAWAILNNFYGVFDGNNHKIIRSNLVINRNDSFTDSEQGFFRTNHGTIKNLTIYDSGTNTYGQYGFDPGKTIYLGMFCGSNYGIIENCTYDSDDQTMAFFVPNAYVGGITGWNTGTITNCNVNTWNIDGFGHKGGISGYNTSSGTITNCMVEGKVTNRYSSDDQTTQYSVGGIVGINYGKINSCINYATIDFFYNGSLSDSKTLQPRMGLIVGTNYGTYSNCSNYGSVDTSELQIITWTTGALWWKEEHSFDQTLYCGGYCGENLA